MQRHGPTEFIGPLRGTTVWWHGTQEAAAAAHPEQESKPAEKTDNSDGIRHELVERVRREIAAGVYDTPEKWEAALDRLLARLGSH